jgi:two-component system chemotaxis sensor kinase CheA
MSEFPVVLYVEDDARSRRVIELLLKCEMNLDHVTIFEDSTDFAARVNTLTPKPDVILLDIHVKPLCGFEMLDILRSMNGYANIPAVALTASVMNEEVQKLREVGFHSVIAKPVDIDAFPDLLQRIAHGEAIWRIIG